MEEGHGEINYPRLKKKKKPKSEANIAQADDGTDSDSSVFSLYYSYGLQLRGI